MMEEDFPEGVGHRLLGGPEEKLDTYDRIAMMHGDRDLVPSPEDAARGVEVEEEIGIPAYLAAGDERAYGLLAKNRAKRKLAEAEALRAFIREPVNYALAQNDLDMLTSAEITLRALSKANNEVVGPLLGRAPASATKMGTIPFTLQGQSMLGMNAYIGKTEEEIYQLLVEERASRPGLSSNEHALRRRAKDLFEMVEGKTALDFAEAARGPLETAGAMSKWAKETFPNVAGHEQFSEELRPSMEAEGWGDQAFLFMKAVANNPNGMAAFTAQIFMESLPSMAAGVGAGLATGSRLAGVAGMGAGSFMLEFPAKMEEFLAENGIDLSTEEGVRNILSNPELMAEAHRKGWSKAIVVASIDALSGGVAAAALSKSPMGDAIAQGFAQAVMGGGGEVLGELAAGDKPTFASAIMEAIIEVPGSVIEVTMVGQRSYGSSERRDMGGRSRQYLQQFDETAANSDMRRRSPRKFNEFVGTIPVEMGVKADELALLFEEEEISPGDLGISQAVFEDALETGGEVVIPMTAYDEHITGTDLAPWFHERATFSELEMSPEENARAQALIEEDRARIDELVARQTSLEEEQARVDESVRQRVQEEISATGVAGTGEEVAALTGALAGFQKAYGGMMGEEGMSPQEFAERFMNLAIQGEGQGSMIAQMVEALRTGEPTETTLTDFVTRLGGLVDEYGTLTETAASDLVTEVGLPIEAAAEAAVEAGFLPDYAGEIDAAMVPVFIQSLIDEAQGMTPETIVTEAQSALRGLASEIERLGIDINAMAVEEIVQALSDATTLNQEPVGAWREASVKVTKDDGTPAEMQAGSAIDVLDERIDAARQLLECVNAG